MLGLVMLSISLLVSPASHGAWYFRLWGLVLGSFLSLITLWNGTLGMIETSGWLLSDGLSSSLVVLTWWISMLMLMASQSSVKLKVNKFRMFSGCICILNIILMMTFLSSSVIWFYVFFEMSLIPTLILILGWGYQPERLQAGMYMMLYTVTASLPLLVLLIFMVNYSNTSSFVLKMMLPGIKGTLSWNTYIKEIVFLVSLAAFLVKLPMYSVHLWLPKAHVEAPVAGSMVLAGVLLKLGGYGILRMYEYLALMETSEVVKDTLFCFAMWGGAITSAICFRQIDLKSLIAYSSVGHMSLMLAGVFSCTSWGWHAALGMMLAHGFCSSALFALANYSYEKTGTRNLMMNKGMLLVCPIMSMWWFLFCVINMAAPPSTNLLSEILIFPSILSSSMWLFLPLGAMSFLAAVYSLFLYITTQHGGFCKFTSPFVAMKSNCLLLLLLHYIPVNFMIMKSEIVCGWFI